MEDAIVEMDQALDVRDSVRAVEADDAFHDAFISRSGNPYLVAALAPLKTMLRRLEVAYFGGFFVARTSVTEHKRILRALVSSEPERAAEIVTANWRRSLKRLRRRSSPGVQSGGESASDGTP
jgi:DNA-binding GntR family transcriptional regulator